MDQKNIVNQLKEFVINSTDIERNTVDEHTDLFQQKILDSLQIVSLVMFIEENFSIGLSFEDLTEDNMRSLAKIADLIISKTK
jgi:acyl carrier protein